MAIAYSMDLRTRVIEASDEGATRAEVARRFGVSERWVYKPRALRRETGTVAPRAGRTGPKLKLAEHVDRLRELVAERPDATLVELCESLGNSVGTTTMWRALHRLKFTLKKSPARHRTAAA